MQVYYFGPFHLSKHLRDCIAFTSKISHILTIKSVYCENYNLVLSHIK